MAKDKEKKHARYLLNKDKTAVELVHADDLDDKMAAGYSEPEGMKANGTKWNEEDDLVQQDIAAELAKQRAELDAKKQAERDKEYEEQRKANEKAAEDAAKQPDMKVQIVEPDKKAAKK